MFEELNTYCSPQTDIEITKEEDFAKILKMEEEYIQQICEDIIRIKPDLVFTEKGISGTETCCSWNKNLTSLCFCFSSVEQVFNSLSDLAQHYLVKANITAIRRVRKTDNNRIARCAALPLIRLW